MKNTIIIAVIALAMWHFLKEGEKVTESGHNLSIPEIMKAGLRSTLKNFLNIANDPTETDAKQWNPEFVNETPSNRIMQNANDPAFSAFSHVQKPRRGNFIHQEYRSN